MHQPFHDEEFKRSIDEMSPNELRVLWLNLTMQLLSDIDDLIEIEGVKDAADYLNRFFE